MIKDDKMLSEKIPEFGQDDHSLKLSPYMDTEFLGENYLPSPIAKSSIQNFFLDFGLSSPHSTSSITEPHSLSSSTASTPTKFVDHSKVN